MSLSLDEATETITRCLLCGSDQLDPLIEVDGARIVECRPCGLGILASRPSEDRLMALYQETYFATNSIGYAKSDDDVAQGVRWQCERVEVLRAFVPRGATVLDIGCASGYFLAAARQGGLEVEGVEPSEWAAEEARRRFGLRVTVGQIGDVPGPHPRFDAVTMWHSLEHTRDPIATLDVVHGLLRDGGILAIELPNYQSIDARGYGASWEGWRVPYHFWHFAPKSLSALVRRCGFDVRMIKTLPSQYIKERVGRIPIIGLFRNRIARWCTGRDFVLVALKRPRVSIQ
jgi:SAM-dependent methyltransferase